MPLKWHKRKSEIKVEEKELIQKENEQKNNDRKNHLIINLLKK